MKYGARFKNTISYGFIQGRTVTDAAREACKLRQKSNWAFKTDISAFFDNVDRQQLNQKIKSVVRDRSLHNLLLAAVSCEIEPQKSKSNNRHIKELGVENAKGIRQGMPLSPFFANLFLESFDKEIIEAGYKAIRYADDLIFFANSHEDCLKIDRFCRQSLLKLNLEIPELSKVDSKTIIAEPHEIIEFLGLGLSPIEGRYELILTKEQRNSIHAELMSLSSINELLARNKKFADLGRTISSRIAGYHSAYAPVVSNYTEFQTDLENIHQKILKAIYGKDGLGIDLKSLSKEKRTFLGIL
jgi:RNA-directed DNA polymerase